MPRAFDPTVLETLNVHIHRALAVLEEELREMDPAAHARGESPTMSAALTEKLDALYDDLDSAGTVVFHLQCRAKEAYEKGETL